MKVRMKTTIAGPGCNAHPGQVIDVENQTGDDLVNGGFAEAIETASIAVPEKAVMPKAKPRKKAKK